MAAAAVVVAFVRSDPLRTTKGSLSLSLALSLSLSLHARSTGRVSQLCD